MDIVGHQVDNDYAVRRESVISSLTDVEPGNFRQNSDSEESEDDFSNPLYRTSTDGTEVCARSKAGRARKPYHAIGAEAYLSDESTSSEQGLHFDDVQPRQWSKEAGFRVHPPPEAASV